MTREIGNSPHSIDPLAISSSMWSRRLQVSKLMFTKPIKFVNYFSVSAFDAIVALFVSALVVPLLTQDKMKFLHEPTWLIIWQHPGQRLGLEIERQVEDLFNQLSLQVHSLKIEFIVKCFAACYFSLGHISSSERILITRRAAAKHVMLSIRLATRTEAEVLYNSPVKITLYFSLHLRCKTDFFRCKCISCISRKTR